MDMDVKTILYYAIKYRVFIVLAILLVAALLGINLPSIIADDANPVDPTPF